MTKIIATSSARCYDGFVTDTSADWCTLTHVAGTPTPVPAARSVRYPADAPRVLVMSRIARGQDVTLLDDGWLRPTLPGEKPSGVAYDDARIGQLLVEWPQRCWRQVDR